MIYFIQAGENGPIKIGQSDNPQERLNQLQTANPYKLKLLWIYCGDSYSEAEIHKMFLQELIRGEWFHPSDSLFTFIRDELNNLHGLEFKNTKTRIDIYESFPGQIMIEGNKFFLNIESDKTVKIMPDRGKCGVIVYGNTMYINGKPYKMPKSGIRCV